MNIKFLQELLSRIDEIKVINKSTEIDGVVYNLAGIVRYGLELRLIILEYDEEFCQQIEEAEIAEICELGKAPENNRNMLKSRTESALHFRHVRSVIIGDKELEVNCTEWQRLNTNDPETILFLTELLRNGWNPQGVDYLNLDMLSLISISLAGDFSKIPNLESNPILHFKMGTDSVSHLVEKPFTLVVNGEYPEKLWFKNKKTGEEHWAQINRVYLKDMWEEVERTFSDPIILQQMSEEEIVNAKKDFEKSFIEICPKGMCYPIVEYECEENISLQFYTKKYLESKPVHNNQSIGFIVRAENKTGILGMKLKATIIQEPVAVNTESIEAELFQYFVTTTPNDIIL